MNYPEFVISRFKGADETASDLRMITGTLAQSLHGVLGLAGELVEIELAESRKNLVEELGDYWFYFRAMSDTPAVPVPDDIALTQVEVMTKLKRATNDVLDAIKKLVIYRKPIDQKLEGVLRNAISTIATNFPILVTLYGLTMEQVEAENVMKLTKRYPEGYSDAAAQARADKAGA